MWICNPAPTLRWTVASAIYAFPRFVTQPHALAIPAEWATEAALLHGWVALLCAQGLCAQG